MNTAENNTFNYHCRRAREGRAKRRLNYWFVQALLIIGMVAGLGFGAVVVCLGVALGWLLIALGTVCLMLLFWIKVELAHVPAGSTDDINDSLTGDVLGHLSKQPTVTELAQILQDTLSGRFMALRFGITTDVLQFVAEKLDCSLEDVFAKAREVAAKTKSEQIEGAVLVVAMVESFADHERFLASAKLELADLYDGVMWFNYLHGLVKGEKQSRHTGGIARDLNFGYIPTLERMGRNISVEREHAPRTQIHIAAHDEIIQKMVQIFSSNGRQNVALIGPAGSGRSTIMNAFAELLLDAEAQISRNLKYRQVFMLDAAALLSYADDRRGGIESLLMEVLGEAYAAKNIIIYLKNAELFFTEDTGAMDVTNVLMPIIDAGNVRMILAMEQQRFLEISAKNAALANALNKIMVTPANEAETMKAMQDRVPIFEYKYNVVYSYLALKEAYRLSERYVHDLEMPGRALNLLESAANFATNHLVNAEAVQAAVEKTEGVKVGVATATAERDKLLNLEDLIHERMIDQVGAVKTVSDALRRAAAGVRNENRPIGTFLFLGPTGVGKTELAKSLSQVYFGGEGELVRLDLNEFVSASDVARLIADGAEDPLSLCAQVMKKPFSVVLLDEIEKAHPQVLTTLLQLLDEGILRDVKNREVSFRDTIVIATSNAGALQIRDKVAAGEDLLRVKDELTNELIKSGEFKPEFLNRFDEICIFQPLSKDDLMKIVDLLVDGVNKTLAPQKISVRLDNEARAILVERGYDPQLGARPMRRIVQQTVENIVAKAVLGGEVNSGAEIMITGEMLRRTMEE